MIIVFGSINVDLVFRMHDTPILGQTLLARELTIQPGGKGANQAVAASRDGAKVYMVGAVGDDTLSSAALAALRDAGVDLSAIQAHPGVATGCASICTNNAGQNQIAVALGANMLVGAHQVDASLLGPDTIVLLQMEGNPDAIAEVIRRARRSSCRIILNLAPAIMLDIDILRMVDIVVVNEDEAELMASTLACEATANALYTALGITVIRTLGSRGAEAASLHGRVLIPAPRIEAVDSTAAGDCFVGVLAAAIERGYSLEVAMRRACAAAALACTIAGSQRSLPDRASIDTLINHL